MITLFTTTKDFIEQNRINQLNAIRGWLADKCKPQVIIFGRSIGMDELGEHPNLLILDQVTITTSGAPFANEMFDAINKISKNDICCYVNADILLPQKFFEDAVLLHEKLKKNYLIVGERIDVDVDNEIQFSDYWHEEFIEKYKSKFKIHKPTGSDFFIYPKGQYTINNMSSILIGRPGWDLWMIYNSRKRNHALVDLSESVRVYHQNHNYSHKKIKYESLQDDPEAMMNLKDIPHPFYIFTLMACNYIFNGNELTYNNARGDMEKYNLINRTINNSSSNLLERVLNKIKRLF